MSRLGFLAPLLLLLTLAGIGPGGCTAPHPAIREGDAESVVVAYGGDVASALPLASKHCAQFDKVPRLADLGPDEASFACVRR